jgi:hypothetical protein
MEPANQLADESERGAILGGGLSSTGAIARAGWSRILRNPGSVDAEGEIDVSVKRDGTIEHG